MPATQIDIFLRILERANIILRMNTQHLALNFLHEFSIPALTACCDRIVAHLPDFDLTDKGLQRELIWNEPFAAYLARLLALIPEEKSEEASSASGRRYGTVPLSLRQRIMGRLYALVQACQENERDITVYPEPSMIDALSLDIQDTKMRLIFLEYFAPMQLNDAAKSTVTANLNCCKEIPLELSGGQKGRLLEPFVSSRTLFSSAPFCEICDLLDACPALLDIIRLLHEIDANEDFGIEEYKLFSQNASEHYRLLRSIADQMDAEAMEMFLAFWQKGGCALGELRSLERWITAHHGQDWEHLFATYSGYINLLYGVRFQKVDLSCVTGVQEDILIYAIVHNKKHFIRMVDEHTELFFSIPRGSVLFQPELYREHLNLNELTERELNDCVWMTQQKLKTDSLIPKRRYTFPELKALYDTSRIYRSLYHALKSDSQDYRLKVFHQLRKRNLLSSDTEEQDMPVLAQYLDQKPLYGWLQEDFGHIKGLTAGDGIKMLIHLGRLRHLVFSMADRKDAMLALRNLDILDQFSGMDDLKKNIVRVDQDWRSLSEAMKLSQEFLELFEENILSFICENGAAIAETYRNSLDSSKQDAFLRVVKAELMGQLDELKYFEGDLQREIDFPLTHQVKAGWKRNLTMERNGLEVGEYDDFFSTMLLGVQPYSTCLAYHGGAYCECLLSSFDSNKKIFYATLGGRIVGRAFLRLTKGRMMISDVTAPKFTFVDLEDVTASRQNSTANQELLTLFLERPYISRVNSEMESRVMRCFVALAQRKAAELGAVLVLSLDYRRNCGASFAQTHFDLYISKSKAGIQYLDSLDGPAEAIKEGSYGTNTFLIQKS